MNKIRRSYGYSRREQPKYHQSFKTGAVPKLRK